MFLFVLLSTSLGSVILGYVAFEFFRKAAARSNEAQYLAYEGMLVGGMVFALNVPAYLPVLFTGLLHVFVMLVVSGTWCGAWISWQAWSTEHPEHRFAPQFSLATLLVYIFGIAGVLAVFVQRR